MPGLVAMEHVVGDTGATGLGEELGVEADQAARGDEVLEADASGAVIHGLRHAAFAQREQLRDDAEEVVGHVDRERLDGLVDLAVDLAGDNLGTADRQLEALAAQGLDEDGELELAAALDDPGVGTSGVLDTERDVADQLGIEAVLQHAGGEAAALEAGERRGVDADQHREAGLIDGDHGERLRIVEVGERLADGDLRDPGDSDDLAGARGVRVYAFQRLGDVHLAEGGALDRAVVTAPGDLLTALERPVDDAAEREPSDVRRGIEVGDQRL